MYFGAKIQIIFNLLQAIIKKLYLCNKITFNIKQNVCIQTVFFDIWVYAYNYGGTIGAEHCACTYEQQGCRGKAVAQSSSELSSAMGKEHYEGERLYTLYI